MRVLSLFSGIGGLDLGLERAGMTIVGMVEKDEFCRSVLRSRWPGIPLHDDARTAGQWWTHVYRGDVDVVAGGPPCQPASTAGRRAGVDDDRWGWGWFMDTVRAVGPKIVIAENPTGILSLNNGKSFHGILREFSQIGLDAEWSTVSACSVGAPHARERVFVVAYPNGQHGKEWLGYIGEKEMGYGHGGESKGDNSADIVAAAVAHGRMDDGVPDRLEPSRVRALGNAVAPPVAEVIGRMVMTRWGIA